MDCFELLSSIIWTDWNSSLSTVNLILIQYYLRARLKAWIAIPEFGKSFEKLQFAKELPRLHLRKNEMVSVIFYPFENPLFRQIVLRKGKPKNGIQVGKQ